MNPKQTGVNTELLRGGVYNRAAMALTFVLRRSYKRNVDLKITRFTYHEPTESEGPAIVVAHMKDFEIMAPLSFR